MDSTTAADIKRAYADGSREGFAEGVVYARMLAFLENQSKEMGIAFNALASRIGSLLLAVGGGEKVAAESLKEQSPEDLPSAPLKATRQRITRRGRTPEQRKQASDRMKKYWAQKRKEFKSQMRKTA